MGLFAASASASLTGSQFGGGDGNLTCNDAGGALDWNCLTNSTSPALHKGIDLPSGTGDNSFGQGTKEDNSNVTLVSGSIPPNKSDLTRFYEASEVLPVGGSNHVFLYLAWERTNVLGSANMDFEINKTGTPCLDSTGPFPVNCTINRSTGDILVTYDFTNGGGTPTIGLRTWNGSSWQPAGSTVVAESAVNSGTVLDTHLPAGSQSLSANTFGEAAIDLTASGLATGCGFSNATTFLKSRSSASFTSEIKDFVSPISTPIAPCGTSIATTLSANSVPVGTAVSDSATLSGATSDAGGTVAYSVYTNNTCSGTPFASGGTKTVTNGTVPDSDSVTFNTAGTYYWQAVYSGDAKNGTSTSPCTSETLVVTPVTPNMSTAQNLLPNDNATLSAGSAPTGTITFSLFSPSDSTCSGTPAYTQMVTVNGNATYSTANSTVYATATGEWRWQVSYSGDNNNKSATSACGVENFTITNG